MFVHTFGAYFGLAISFVFGMKEKPKEHHLEGPSYNSDIFAMIGLFFLLVICKILTRTLTKCLRETKDICTAAGIYVNRENFYNLFILVHINSTKTIYIFYIQHNTLCIIM